MRSGALPSDSYEHFARTPSIEIERSAFNRDNGYKTTFNAGQIIPFLVDEILPGDTFNVSSTFFIRMQNPTNPFMDNLMADVHYFAIPNRILWSHWVNFMGEKNNPTDNTVYTVPYLNLASGYTIGSLPDYMGLGGLASGSGSLRVNALPFRAYNRCLDVWYRDQNLMNQPRMDTGDGPDDPQYYTVGYRCKRHDYFTSCLPWPQKGTAVSLPLGTRAPVMGIGVVSGTANGDVNLIQSDTAGTATGSHKGWAFGATTGFLDKLNTSGNAGTGAGNHSPDVWADLSNAVAANVNDIRLAFQTQRMLEKDARGGTRYPELVYQHFRVENPDSRMQRPEILGMGSFPVVLHPVAQTSEPTAGNPLGRLAAFATAQGGAGFSKSFTEHCVLLGLISIRADLNYQQGMEKMWTRSTRYDFYWPSLAHIGEQAVLNQEIYCDVYGAPTNTQVFGYQERYAEYRYKPSRVTGKFRSWAAGTLDMWHLAQNFTSLPALNEVFIQENPPMSRVLAVTDQPQFYMDSFTRMKCVRPMPTYSVPGLIDHY